MQKICKVYLIPIFLLISVSVFAQQSTARSSVEGYSGIVQVIPSLSLKTTTVALAMSYKSAIASQQIVFHLQQYGPNIPDFWNGSARVLSGQGLLAVIPKDGSQAILFKFKEVSVPSSFQAYRFKVFLVYGIGYFGENAALTEAQIQNLASTGSMSASFANDNDPSFFHSLDTDPNTDCVAGGPGATSCSAAGCTVTCGGGTYSCCEGGTCHCRQPGS